MGRTKEPKYSSELLEESIIEEDIYDEVLYFEEEIYIYFEEISSAEESECDENMISSTESCESSDENSESSDESGESEESEDEET